MSVNDKVCWTNTTVGTMGTQECGGIYLEEVFRVAGCYATLSGSEAKLPLTVRVWTNLDGDASDESFGINNVLVEQGLAERTAVVKNVAVYTLIGMCKCTTLTQRTHMHMHPNAPIHPYTHSHIHT